MLPQAHFSSHAITAAEINTNNNDEAAMLAAFVALVELSKIIEDMLSQIFGTKMIKKIRKELVLFRSARLEELMVRLHRWHSTLPKTLAWNQWNPPAEALTPHAAILQ